MSKTVATSKRKAIVKDARPANKAKAPEKPVSAVKPVKSTEAGKAKTEPKPLEKAKHMEHVLAGMSRKRAADSVEDDQPVKEETPGKLPKAKAEKATDTPGNAPKSIMKAKTRKHLPKLSGHDESESAQPKAKKVKISKSLDVAEAVSSASSVERGKSNGSRKAGSLKEKALISLVDYENVPDSDDESEDVAALLAGFSSDSESSAAEDEGIPLEKLPEPKIGDKDQKALHAAKKKASDEDIPGTLYIGRIPHGFYEHQMRAYFSQFGTITHLRLSRNKRTGASKHYAFLQFSSGEVADIVARTMNNYLMFGHILKVRVMKPEDIHAKLWQGADRKYKVVPWGKIEGRRLAGPKGRQHWKAKAEREIERRKKQMAQMKELGYDFNAPVLRNVDDVPMKEDVPVEELGKLIKVGDSAVVVNKVLQIAEKPMQDDVTANDVEKAVRKAREQRKDVVEMKKTAEKEKAQIKVKKTRSKD